MQNTLAHLIETTPGVCGSKPRIAGRRISVANIAIWHERMGLSADDIADQYELTLAQVHAALAYYWENREEIDQTIRADEEFVSGMRARATSKLSGKQRE